MSEARRPKRPRLEPPELPAGSRFLLQRTSMKPGGDLWPPHDIRLLLDGRHVSVDGSPPHGYCYMTDTHMALSYQCPFDENKEKESRFVAMKGADVWVQVHCDAEMHCVLARPLGWPWPNAERSD